MQLFFLVFIKSDFIPWLLLIFNQLIPWVFPWHFPGAFLAVLEFPNSWLKLPLHFTSWFPEDVAPRGIRLGKLRCSEKRGSEETGSKNKQESQSGQHTVSKGQRLRKRRRAKDRKHRVSSLDLRHCCLPQEHEEEVFLSTNCLTHQEWLQFYYE